MANKPKIQYVGQFYVYGSEAQKVALDAQKKKAKTLLPLPNLDKHRRIYVDPVAVCGLIMAVVLFTVMVMGALQIQSDWTEFRAAKEYLQTMESENRALENKYHAEYNLDEVRSIAESMGMVPVADVPHLNITVTVPVPGTEPTQWENFVWFMSGLFA